MKNIVERVENLFIQDGFHRMSEYFDDWERFHKDYENHQVLWASDNYYVVEGNLLGITIYHKDDYMDKFEVIMSFPDHLSDKEIKRLVQHMIYDPSQKQKEILEKYIDISEDYGYKEKQDAISYDTFYDAQGNKHIHKSYNVKEKVDLELYDLEKEYEIKKKRYGEYNTICLELLLDMIYLCRVNGLFERGYRYSLEFCKNVQEVSGKNSPSYFDSLYFTGLFLYHLHYYERAFDLLTDAHQQLHDLDQELNVRSLEMIILIMKCCFRLEEYEFYNKYSNYLCVITSDNEEFIQFHITGLFYYIHSLLILDEDNEAIDDLYKEISESEFEWTPDMMVIHGMVCMEFGLDKEAIHQLKLAYDLYRYYPGVKNYQALECVNLIAQIAYRSGNEKDAIELLKYVSHSYKLTLGVDNAYYCDSLYNLADLYVRDKKWGKSYDISKQAYDLYCKLIYKESICSLKALKLYAYILYSMKRYDEELPLRKEIIEISKELYGEKDRRTIEVTLTYSLCLYHNNDNTFLKVGEYYIKALKDIQPDDYTLVEGMKKYTDILEISEHYEEALEYNLEGIKILNACETYYPYIKTELIYKIGMDYYYLDRKEEVLKILYTHIKELEEMEIEDCVERILPMYESIKEKLYNE